MSGTVVFKDGEGITVSIDCSDDVRTSEVVIALCHIIADILVASNVEPHEIDELSQSVGETVKNVYTHRMEVKNAR